MVSKGGRPPGGSGENPERVLSQHLANPILGKATANHELGELREPGRVDGRMDIAVEIGSNRRRLLASDLDDVLDVQDRLLQARLRESRGSEHHSDDAALLGQCPNLIVGEISPSVIDRSYPGVAHQGWVLGEGESFEERLLRGVSEIDEEAGTIHFSDELSPQLRESAVRARGASADLVSTQMDEPDGQDSASPEVRNASEVALERMSPLDSMKERELAFLVVSANGRGIGRETRFVSERLGLRELSLETLPGREPGARRPSIMEGFETGDSEKSRGHRKRHGIDPPSPHPGKIHVTAFALASEVARPEKRVDV